MSITLKGMNIASNVISIFIHWYIVNVLHMYFTCKAFRVIIWLDNTNVIINNNNSISKRQITFLYQILSRHLLACPSLWVQVTTPKTIPSLSFVVFCIKIIKRWSINAYSNSCPGIRKMLVSGLSFHNGWSFNPKNKSRLIWP